MGLGFRVYGLRLGDILTKPIDPKEWWGMIEAKLVVPIDIGEIGKTGRKCGEKNTSVTHTDHVSKTVVWSGCCLRRIAMIDLRTQASHGSASPSPTCTDLYGPFSRSRSLEPGAAVLPLNPKP